ncbi:LysM peptidoglycan-binding domain-containing protein [Solidesulfovibrio sp.]
MKFGYALAAALTAGLCLVGCNKEDAKGFPKVDYNKDGKVIFEELIVVFPDLTVDEFLAADGDGTGTLDEKEYTRFRQAREAGKPLEAIPAVPPAAKPADAAKPASEAKPAPEAKPAAEAVPAGPGTQAAPAVPAAPTPPSAPTEQAEVVETVVAETSPPAAPEPAATTYTVARGDSLSRIARIFGLTTKELMAANSMKNADHLEAGAVLTIPGAAPDKAAAPAVPPAVTAFVADYFARSAAGDVTALVDLYGESVEYYKKGRAGSDVVRQDKAAYFERWPERTYTAGAVRVTELAGGDLKVTIPTEYTVRRADKSAKGQATFTLVLRPAGGSFRIVGEQSVVTERK